MSGSSGRGLQIRQLSSVGFSSNSFLGLKMFRTSEEERQPNSNDGPERGYWGGKCEFLLASLGSAVGLGNLWRFPFLAFKMGGGAFLIPYVVMGFLVGIPVLLMEMTIGQYSALGPGSLFPRLSPLFGGLGRAMVITSFYLSTFYNLVISWTLFYFFETFRSTLLWERCDNWFNTENCFNEGIDYRNCKAENSSNVYFNNTCFNSTFAAFKGITEIPSDKRVSPSQEFFSIYMLNVSSGIDIIGSIQWRLALCLLAAWTIVVLSLIKGIKSSGKVVYFTATFPYVILVIFFIHGLTLEGAKDGLKYYFVPNFTKLQESEVWIEATVQVLISFSIAGGATITYASYNPFNNKIIKDVFFIGLGDMLTSIFSGTVVFLTVGFMAKQLGKEVDKFEGGAGLAFVSYPEAISQMSGSGFWALSFFLMLFLLGIDSQFAMTEAVFTYIFDQFPKTRKFKPFVVSTFGIIFFSLGLLLTTRGGSYVLDLLNHYAVRWTPLLAAFLECVIIGYLYGINNFLFDLQLMQGSKLSRWLRYGIKLCIGIISPLVIGTLIIVGLIYYEPLQSKDYVFPPWAHHVGIVIAVIPVLFILIGIIHEICKKSKGITFRQRAKKWITPKESWYANARENSMGQLKSLQTGTELKSKGSIEESTFDSRSLSTVCQSQDTVFSHL